MNKLMFYLTIVNKSHVTVTLGWPTVVYKSTSVGLSEYYHAPVNRQAKYKNCKTKVKTLFVYFLAL